jgi:DNA-binding response OmpR family regulator
VDQPLNILILEDQASDIDLMEFELQEAGLTFISKRVMYDNEYLKGLQEFSPDLILSDYDLPQYNGALALNEARIRCPDVPFILVTGAIGEDRAIEVLTQGAKDYVLKNRLQRLVPAVRRALSEAEEQKKRKKAEEKLASSNLHLEQLVIEQTQALDQLNRELQAKNRERDIIYEALKTYQREAEVQKDAFQLAREWRLIFDAITNPVWIIDGNAIIMRCNTATTKLLDRDDKEIIGHKCYEILHGTSAPIKDCPAASTMANGKRSSATLQICGKMVNITTDALINEVDQIIGAVHILSH